MSDYENNLEAHIERMVSLDLTVEQYLNRFPHAAPYGDLLISMSLLSRSGATMVAPRTEKARSLFLTSVDEAAATKHQIDLKVNNSFGTASPWNRFRQALALVVASLILSGGVAVAAGNSLPNETLYTVKRGIETGRLNLSFSSSSKAGLYIDIARERLKEITLLVKQGDRVDAISLSDDIDDDLNEALKFLNDSEFEGRRAAIAEIKMINKETLKHLELLKDENSPRFNSKKSEPSTGKSSDNKKSKDNKASDEPGKNDGKNESDHSGSSSGSDLDSDPKSGSGSNSGSDSDLNSGSGSNSGSSPGSDSDSGSESD